MPDEVLGAPVLPAALIVKSQQKDCFYQAFTGVSEEFPSLSPFV